MNVSFRSLNDNINYKPQILLLIWTVDFCRSEVCIILRHILSYLFRCIQHTGNRTASKVQRNVTSFRCCF